MISIGWQPGRAPSVLSALMDDRLASLCAKAAAESYEDDIRDWVAAGHAFTPRTGQTMQSIGWLPQGNGAIVYANAQTALFLERGTGLYGPNKAKYKIAPKPGRKGLRIPLPGGGDIIRRFVMHPGIKAKPFFFADFDARERRMLAAMAGVVAAKIDGAR